MYHLFCCFLFCRLKSIIIGKSVHEYVNDGTLAKLGLKQSTVTKSETQGDRSKCTNVGTVDHLLDEEGVYHFTHLIDGGRFVTADARATSLDASAKKTGINTSFSSMQVSAASSLPNEEFNVHDMRVPATKLTKNAPQFDRGKLT